MKVLSSIWFSEMGSVCPIGIVRIKNDHGEIKSYIRTGSGIDQKQDEIMIAEQGAKFPDLLTF